MHMGKCASKVALGGSGYGISVPMRSVISAFIFCTFSHRRKVLRFLFRENGLILAIRLIYVKLKRDFGLLSEK